MKNTPDAGIYLSLPGLGGVLGARVLGEFGDDSDRYADAKSRKNYAGTSPITVASGKKKAVIARHIRNRRLYDAIDAWAFCSITASQDAERSMTNDEPLATTTTEPCVRSAIASSASSTDAFVTGPTTTNTPPGDTANQSQNEPLLDDLSPGVSISVSTSDLGHSRHRFPYTMGGGKPSSRTRRQAAERPMRQWNWISRMSQ